ncbi:MAG: PspC domain-containing protein [bacterium]
MARIIDPIKDGKRRLTRIKQDKIIGGVCAGFAYWLGWPTWLVRALLVILVLTFGSGILGYIIFWIFMPVASELPSDYYERTSQS